MWAIAANSSEVELSLQEQIDIVPQGGTIVIKGGVYELNKPIVFPDDAEIVLEGCTFVMGEKAKTVQPAQIVPAVPVVYWAGTKWASEADAALYATKELAERAAFRLVTKNPVLIGVVMVCEV